MRKNKIASKFKLTHTTGKRGDISRILLTLPTSTLDYYKSWALTESVTAQAVMRLALNRAMKKKQQEIRDTPLVDEPLTFEEFLSDFD